MIRTGRWAGRRVLGDEISLAVQCKNGSGTPSAPTAAPTYRVYTEAGTNVVNGSLPPIERYTATGLFGRMLPLNSSFSTGRHYVRYAYAISGTNYVDTECFEVVAGGNVSGQHIAMHYIERPDGQDWILTQTDQASVTLNRGPRL